MSLLSHLNSRDSPVRRWFVEHFPETRRCATEANKRLRGGRRLGDCPIVAAPGADAGLVGTAVDYLLRACLREGALDATVAHTGARLLDTYAPETEDRAVPAVAAAVARIDSLRPWTHSLDPGAWRELCELCLLLARLEQVYRAGHPEVFALAAEPFRVTADDDPLTLARAVAGNATIEDLVTLGALAVADHADLRTATPLVLNPTFTQSALLRGADADLIAAHTLLDFKSTKHGGVIGAVELWQLLGYVFADTDDEYGIRAAGVSALRWRTRVVWTVEELEAALGAPARPLSEWRSDFAALLSSRRVPQPSSPGVAFERSEPRISRPLARR